ncbi:sodium/calcium exchanger Calx [Parasteatoda tepidariorum]|uniref:sodium/calcium exchanger Calx n=1 Tax=Parasteatoda tepidariorum TaxID=114398 RepID=UPI00077F8486|nr:sodium/calcium exchanger 3 [Parasteatoda tepidariorum]
MEMMYSHHNHTFDYRCSEGLLLPIINESTWNPGVRAFIYLLGLLYCFLGVAIIADIFMCSIEKITSKTRKIMLSTSDETEPEVIEVKVWNDTVANLTLMALGSSAPEILLSIIEIVGNGFKAGDLGPGTIVGSAAFNLLVICGVCIVALPAGESRRIRTFSVFSVTAFFSVFAYIWLLIILVGFSPHEVEIWEAVVTFLFFPLLVGISYAADKGLCRVKILSKTTKQMEVDSSTTTVKKEEEYFPKGQLSKETLVKFIKEVRKHPALSAEDAACLAAARLVEETDHTRMWYKINAIRELSGGRKPKPRLSKKLEKVYSLLGKEDETDAKPAAPMEQKDIPMLDFVAATAAVMENAGKVAVKIRRHGKTTGIARCRVETIDGTAVSGEDYVPVKEILTFQDGETEKELSVGIVDDNQWEPDETFFLKLCILPEDVGTVMLGRVCIMEITILNDDEPGILQFKRRGILVKESIGAAHVPVVRTHGVDGTVKTKWRTIDRTAVSGKDYYGGEGEIVFDHGEVEKNIEIQIVDDFNAEKDEHFEVELFDATGGVTIGQINRSTVTITNDDDYNSIVERVALMTNVNVDNVRLQSETWGEQFRAALTVNGGDIENATTQDYVLHFLTFGWKAIFAIVPPTGMCGGWLTFCVSLILIGVLTAIVGDLASIFGCLVGLKDAVTAITFVALGTSLPDLFASMAAAKQEKYADSCIGNVTGSNSVNVFLGLGLPWLMASIYWASKGETFHVKAGTLGFSVGIYTALALICIALIVSRRFLTVLGKAELGGPRIYALICCIAMISMWFLYVLLSSFEAYGYIQI